MSANTAIKEGGNPHSFGPVDYLRVASGSDQYALWVPESERALTTKSIDKNGIYRASDDGAYGWSSVYVNVPKPDSVTGKDDDGDEIVVKPDPDTGVLEEEKVPSSIEITTPPTKLIYTDGETIDFTGAVVKAYLETGGEYGTVPNGEITLNPTTAVYDSTKDIEELVGDGISVLGHTGMLQYRKSANPSQYIYKGIWGAESMPDKAEDNPEFAYPIVYTSSSNQYRLYFTSYNGNVYVAGETSFSSVVGIHVDGSHGGSCGKPTKVLHKRMAEDHEADARAVALSMAGTSTVDPEGVSIDDLERTEGSPQTITVSWPRPGDGAILETSFNIIVQQSFGGASGGGGQAGETGAGRND